KKLFNSIYKFFNSTESFIKTLPLDGFYNEVILVKGAFSFKFNEIAELLTLKKHDTVMEINLHALINNLNTFKSLLKPETKTMCMVKAFSYGTGSYEVAQSLEFNGVDYLGVAYADEGVLLRKNGVSLPIMVLNPEQSSYDAVIKYNLEPEIYSLRVLNKFIQALEKNNISFDYPIHIKIDTGMNRLGFKESEIDELKLNLEVLVNKISVTSVFSHLAESENTEDKAFTLAQLSLFDKLYSRLTFGATKKPFRHLLNSSGILNYKEHQYEMVRLGIGLYGYTSNQSIVLENVAKFKTVISQIKTIEKGESVSYNRNFIAKEKTRIAILPVGYADGIHRIAGNEKGFVGIKNKRAKILGTICMDILMVDVSNINCEEGDEVCVFGSNPSLKEVADFCDTIPYEILTSISQRVKRVYYKE
ncbi:MAG: alanine racemase, partial [Solirubrobacteraceae bacterium]